MGAQQEQISPVAGRQTWLWVLPILLFSAAVGYHGIGTSTFWFDEVWSLAVAGALSFDGVPHPNPLPIQAIWERAATQDGLPPGYYLLLGFWGRVAGWSPFSVRVLSLLFGLLAIAMVYRLGRDAVNAHVGLYAAFFLGTSAYFAYYLHEARMYTMLVFLTTAFLWVYQLIVPRERPAPRWSFVALFSLTVCLLYITYFGAFVVASAGFYHLLVYQQTRRWWLAVAVVALAGLAFLPWVATMVQHLLAWRFAADVPPEQLDPLKSMSTPPWILNQSLAGLTNSRPFDAAHTVVSFVPLFILLLSIAILGTRWRAKGQILLLLAFMLIQLVAFHIVANRFLGFRYAFITLPLVFLLLAVGTQRLARWRWVPPSILLIWLVSGWFAPLDYEYRYIRSWYITMEWEEIRTEVGAILQEGDAVLVVSPSGFFYWLHELPASYHLYPYGVGTYVMPREDNQSSAKYHEQFQTLPNNDERLVVIVDPAETPDTLTTFSNVIYTYYPHCATPILQPRLHVHIHARVDVGCAAIQLPEP